MYFLSYFNKKFTILVAFQEIFYSIPDMARHVAFIARKTFLAFCLFCLHIAGVDT